MRIDDREHPVGRAAEQVARARGRVVQERAKQHQVLLSAGGLDGQSGAAPFGEADIQPARAKPRARSSRTASSAYTQYGPRQYATTSPPPRQLRHERRQASRSAPRRAPAICPARYSGSGRTSSTTTSPRASRACKLVRRHRARRRPASPRYSSASTLTSATCSAATSRTAAHRSTTRHSPAGRRPACRRARERTSPPAPAPADAATCWRRSARSRAATSSTDRSPCAAHRRSPPAGRYQAPARPTRTRRTAHPSRPTRHLRQVIT